MAQALWSVISEVVSVLEAIPVSYSLINDSALFAQGVEVVPEELEFSVQWDNFPAVHERLITYGASPIEDQKAQGWSDFTLQLEGVLVRIICYYNTVIVTNPQRLHVERDGQKIYFQSAMSYRRVFAPDDPRQELITEYYIRLQKEMSAQNGRAWNESPYEAWLQKLGTPKDSAERIKKDPLGRLKPLGKFFRDVEGKKVANLLGSHGSKAIALTLPGAKATVVDISSENARFAREAAAEAGVDIHYVVSDLLELPQEELTGDYDYVLMENGILHYFVDLQPVARIIAGLLGSGGRLILHDFHPISTKLITSKGKKHKVTGDYFYPGLEAGDVPYSKLLSENQDLNQVLVRRWTIGEIVTAMADSGLIIKLLEEEPNTKVDDIGLPKTYTLVAEKL